MVKLKTILSSASIRAIVGVSAVVALLLFTGAVYVLFGDSSERESAVVEDEAPLVGPALSSDPHRSGLREFPGRVGEGQPFVTALLQAGLDRAICDTIQRHFEAVDFNFRQCMPGQTFVAQIDSSGALHAFRYDAHRLLSWWITRDTVGLLYAQRWEVPVETQIVSVEGSVQSSVNHSILSMGEKPQLVADYADVLGYDVDFIFDPRVGDRFSILVEKKMLDGELVGYGRILAASYDGEITGNVRGYYFDADSTAEGYYAPDGENLRKAFMRTPLSILRVTSNFGMRTHPISGKRKMHTGIDYAAPTGTPVWAVGSGTVVFTGWKGGYGKTVEIKHAGGVRTRYGHLSRIHVKVGQGVRQQQTIGAVGSTGYSTGPHLHFEYLVGGQFVPPRRVKNPSLKRLPEEYMPAFTERMADMDSLWTRVPRIRETPFRLAVARASIGRPAS
jgi:murein DD-endopeptidase MepM/ murein hydrolase activator NlpD